MFNRQISIEEYDYHLPEEQIAQFPLKSRDLSKLLIALHQPYEIVLFKDIIDFLPENAVLIYNDTRVIPARLIFQKPTGARIEIFLVKPSVPSNYEENFNSKTEVTWEVMIGNASKWKEGELQMFWQDESQKYELYAFRKNNREVLFKWHPTTLSFGELLDKIAHVPLPPYIKRAEQPDDKIHYQTVYAYRPGSVAAPTAGLHFTRELLDEISKRKNIVQIPLTLHVGLGTFKPVKSAIEQHQMHAEPVFFSMESLKRLADYVERPWVVVGTTSLRALESLYFYLYYLDKGKQFSLLPQWVAWETASDDLLPRKVLFDKVRPLLEGDISFETQLFILPGKPILMADYLITNFHQPRSTLLLLVDAFSSEPWRKVYSFALENNLRFLSYGDACLLKNKLIE